MQILSVANCWPPMECRQPETEMGKPFEGAERTISASSSRVRGFSSSRTRVRLSCEWTSLTQISFPRSAKTCGASAKSAAVRMNSRRVSIAGASLRQLDCIQTNYLAFCDDFLTEIRFHFL